MSNFFPEDPRGKMLDGLTCVLGELLGMVVEGLVEFVLCGGL
jgi:hypothetical protein